MQVQNSIKNHIDFVLKKIDMIEKKDSLNIHDMADLARYSKSLRYLMESYEIANKLML